MSVIRGQVVGALEDPQYTIRDRHALLRAFRALVAGTDVTEAELSAVARAAELLIDDVDATHDAITLLLDRTDDPTRASAVIARLAERARGECAYMLVITALGDERTRHAIAETTLFRVVNDAAARAQTERIAALLVGWPELSDCEELVALTEDVMRVESERGTIQREVFARLHGAIPTTDGWRLFAASGVRPLAWIAPARVLRALCTLEEALSDADESSRVHMARWLVELHERTAPADATGSAS